MKRKALPLIFILCCVLFSACTVSNKDLDKYVNRNFKGSKGGYILITTDKSGSNKTLMFSGTTVIKPNTDPSKLSEKSVKKEKPQEFKNPKIVKSNDGKYLQADNFSYKLKIVDDDTIVDVEDENEYRSLSVKK